MSVKSLTKWIGMGALGVAVLAALAYAVVSSDTFVRLVILPKIARQLDADIEATSIDFKPFAKLEFGELRLATHDGRLTGNLDTVSCTYRIAALWRGEIDIPVFTVRGGNLALAVGDSADPTSSGVVLIDAPELTLHDLGNDGRQGQFTAAATVSNLGMSGIAVENAAVALRGTLSLDSALTPVSLQALVTVANVAVGSQATAQLEVSIAYAPHATVSAKGVLLIKSAALASPALGEQPMPAMDLSITHDVTLDQRERTLRVDAFDLTLNQDGTERIKVDITRPFVLKWGPEGRHPTAGEAKLGIAISGLDARLINLFLAEPAEGRVEQGDLYADLELRIADMGDRIDARGRFGVDNLTIAGEDWQMRGLSIGQDLDISLDELDVLKINAAATVATIDGQNAVRLSHDGSGCFSTRDGTYTLTIKELNRNVVNALPPKWRRDVRCRHLIVAGKLTATSTNGGRTLFSEGFLQVPWLQIVDLEYGPLAPSQVDLKWRLTFEDGQLNIKVLHLNAASGALRTADLDVQGRIALPFDRGKSVLEINSEILDLQALAAVGYRAATPAERRKPKEPDEDKPDERLDIRELDLVVHVAIAQLLYGEVAATDLAAEIRIDDRTITATRVDAVLSGAPLHIEGTMDLGVTDYTYTLAASLGAVDLQPFLIAFGPPPLHQQLQGRLSGFDLNLQGRGFQRQDLETSMTGSLELGLEHLVIQNIPDLTAIARQANLPELNRLEFNHGILRAGTGAQGINVQALTLRGEDLTAVATGAMDFGLALNLKLGLAVAGDLEKRLTGNGMDQVLGERLDGRRPLSFAIPIGGTLLAPRVAFRIDALTP